MTFGIGMLVDFQALELQKTCVYNTADTLNNIYIIINMNVSSYYYKYECFWYKYFGYKKQEKGETFIE